MYCTKKGSTITLFTEYPQKNKIHKKKQKLIMIHNYIKQVIAADRSSRVQKKITAIQHAKSGSASIDDYKLKNINGHDSKFDVTITKDDITARQNTLINTMTKRMILVFFSVVPSLILAVSLTVRVESGHYKQTHINANQNYWRLLNVVVCQTNIICLLCQFGFFQHDKYEKYCKICHIKCKDCVSYFVVKSMKQITYTLPSP